MLSLKKTASILTLVACTASWAGAQTLNGKLDPKLKLQQSQQSKQEKALRETVTAMNDGNSAGELVLRYLGGMDVVFAKQSEPSKIAQSGPHGERTLYLSDALPMFPRVLGLAIAEAAAQSMFSDMSRCAERDYMEQSVAARVWLELGGEKDKLPVLEPLTGYVNAELASGIMGWMIRPAESALEAIGIADNVPSLMTLQDDNRKCLDSGNYHVMPMCQEEKAKLEADNERFVSLLKDEQGWRAAHP